jgi:transaldolase
MHSSPTNCSSDLFGSEQWRTLEAAGARVQRPLWASTGTKNKDYRDVLYVETLIGPDTVNTMPVATIEAFLDHGVVAPHRRSGLCRCPRGCRRSG